MAVYTALTTEALRGWLSEHEVGTLVAFEGIASGIENSNYFVTTDDRGFVRRFVLTLFERLSVDALPYYLTLMKHLAAHDVPCPSPAADRRGALASMLCGKPAALVSRLDGRSIVDATPAHCAAMGRVLATMHRAALDFDGHQPNPRGIDWWIAAAARVRPHLDDTQRALLDDEIALQSSTWGDATRELPRSAIHADLFRDNALFVDDGSGRPALGGVIDFYFAGDDAWALDLATCLNDWCIDLETGAWRRDALDAFVGAYDEARPLTAGERAAMPLMLRAAALRFWLSRVDDLHRPRPAELLTPHDPRHFERILRRRRADALDGAGPFAGMRG